MKLEKWIKEQIVIKEMEVEEISNQVNFGRWNELDRNKIQRKQQLCCEISVLEQVLN